jgi:hypothetical protein
MKRLFCFKVLQCQHMLYQIASKLPPKWLKLQLCPCSILLTLHLMLLYLLYSKVTYRKCSPIFAVLYYGMQESSYVVIGSIFFYVPHVSWYSTINMRLRCYRICRLQMCLKYQQIMPSPTKWMCPKKQKPHWKYQAFPKTTWKQLDSNTAMISSLLHTCN